MSEEIEYCPDLTTAPHGCALIRRQVIVDAEGQPIGVYVCNFCPRERAKEERLGG
jgi:hypothetical protein